MQYDGNTGACLPRRADPARRPGNLFTDEGFTIDEDSEYFDYAYDADNRLSWVGVEKEKEKEKVSGKRKSVRMIYLR